MEVQYKKSSNTHTMTPNSCTDTGAKLFAEFLAYIRQKN